MSRYMMMWLNLSSIGSFYLAMADRREKEGRGKVQKAEYLENQKYIFMQNKKLDWGSLQARLNNPYKAWSYKKKKQEQIKPFVTEICLERT